MLPSNSITIRYKNIFYEKRKNFLFQQLIKNRKKISLAVM